jgi:hypothetical protein
VGQECLPGLLVDDLLQDSTVHGRRKKGEGGLI